MLVIQTENKIFRLYILLLHTPVKSLTYFMMFYLSQPKGKNRLSFSPNKLYQLPPVSYKKSTQYGETLMLFNAILTVSQFQFINISILAYTSPHHLRAPPQVVANCYHELPVGSFSLYCSYWIRQVLAGGSHPNEFPLTY